MCLLWHPTLLTGTLYCLFLRSLYCALQPSVLIKSSLFIGPLGWFLRYCGAIPVNRTQANSLVDYITGIYTERDEFVFDYYP